MTSKTKIPVAHVFLTLNIGGMEKVGIDLIEQLDTDRYDNHIICLKEIGALGRQLQASGNKAITLVSLDKPEGLAASVLLSLIRYFRQHRIQIVHTNNSGPHFWAGLAAVLCGIKVRVHTNHGRNKVWTTRRALLDRFSARLSQRIICVSQDSANKLREQDGISADKLVVIPNGVNTGLFAPGEPDRDLMQALGLVPAVPVIGAIARFSTDKDQACLVRAFAKVLKQRPDLQLLLVGDGETRSSVEALAVELGVRDKTVFTGFRSDIADTLRLLDIYVLPTHTEGLSISLLEAMATARPVVASAVGGNVEIVADGENGLLVPESDVDALATALDSLLENTALAQSLSGAARQTVLDSYSIRAMANQYQDLYESLL